MELYATAMLLIFMYSITACIVLFSVDYVIVMSISGFLTIIVLLLLVYFK